MHPPFYVVDHRVGAPDPHSVPKPRRGAPARLDLAPGPAHWAPVPFVQPGPLVRPEVAQVLWLAPPPRGLRARLGRWLVRAGQRLAAPPPRA